MKKSFFFLLLTLLCCNLLAQDYTISLTGGYLCSMAPKWRYMQAPTIGFDVSLSTDLSGSKFWQRWWRIPTFGARANATHVCDGIAGDRFGLTGFVQSPLWRSQKLDVTQLCPEPSPHYLYWEVDAGFAFYSRPYERVSNELNDFIGTYLNCQLQLGIGYRRTFTDGSAWQFAAKIVHNSNGQLTQHNKGLNYLQGELGWRLAPSHHYSLAPDYLNPDTTTPPAHSTLFLAFAPSVVMSRHLNNNTHAYYYAYSAQLGFKVHLNSCLAFGSTIDMMYNYSHLELYKAFGVPYSYPFYLGVLAFAEPRWGALSLRAGLGFYLPEFTCEMNDQHYYERFGLFYHFGREERQSFGVAMKLHQARIDYIEWTYAVDLW